MIDKPLVEKYTKVPANKIEARGTGFPRIVRLLWIPQGVHVEIVVSGGAINASVWKPDDINDHPTEYQELLVNCEDEIKKVLARLERVDKNG